MTMVNSGLKGLTLNVFNSNLSRCRDPQLQVGEITDIIMYNLNKTCANLTILTWLMLFCPSILLKEYNGSKRLVNVGPPSIPLNRRIYHVRVHFNKQC